MLAQRTTLTDAHDATRLVRVQLVQVVENVLARDKDFQAWREQNPDSYVPKAGEWKKKRSGRQQPAQSAPATPAVPLAKSA